MACNFDKYLSKCRRSSTSKSASSSFGGSGLLRRARIADVASSSPVVRVQRYAPGLAQIGADERPPLGGVHRGDRDGLVPGVCPVKVVLEPVQGQTHGSVEVRVHQRHLLRGVAGLVDEGTVGGGGRTRVSVC